MIGGIKEKIPTAFDDHVDVFFCARGNYKDAKEAYDCLPN
jgi:PDZ domain-containing secreted protein